MKRVLLSLLFCTYGLRVCLGQKIIENIKYQTEVGAFLSTSGQNPFWLRSNQYGIVPLESQFLTFRGAAHKEYDSTKTQNHKISKFSYGYGASTAVNVGKINQIYLPEAYFKVRYGAFEFYGGRRKEIAGLVDTTLTSGSYIWSGNALPIPKIQISIPNYTSVIGKGLLSIKGSYAHGWFGTQGNTKNFFLHQKTFYGIIGKPNWKVKFYGGFNHQVQWGGKPVKPYIEPQTGKFITTYGNDFKTYLNVVSGVSLNTKGGTDIPDIPINEAWNRSGNHLGTIDLGTNINLSSCDIFVYRQSIFEDGSLFYLNNITDGVLGLSYKAKNTLEDISILGINIEFINTMSQGGSIFLNAPPELRGEDNYFNNGLYSWTYQNRIIGTPLIMNLPINDELIKTNQDYFDTIPQSQIINNRVSAISTKFKLKLSKFTTLSHILYSRNQGAYHYYFKRNQISILQEINTLYKQKSIISFRIAYDSGGILNKKLGMMLAIKRHFF